MDLNTQRDGGLKIEKVNIFSKVKSFFFPKEKSELSAYYDFEETEDLIESIRDARKEWISENVNFEYAIEKDIIDYYTYRIKATQLKYEHLLKIAKKRGIKLEIM